MVGRFFGMGGGGDPGPGGDGLGGDEPHGGDDSDISFLRDAMGGMEMPEGELTNARADVGTHYSRIIESRLRTNFSTEIDDLPNAILTTALQRKAMSSLVTIGRWQWNAPVNNLVGIARIMEANRDRARDACTVDDLPDAERLALAKSHLLSALLQVEALDYQAWDLSDTVIDAKLELLKQRDDAYQQVELETLHLSLEARTYCDFEFGRMGTEQWRLRNLHEFGDSTDYTHAKDMLATNAPPGAIMSQLPEPWQKLHELSKISQANGTHLMHHIERLFAQQAVIGGTGPVSGGGGIRRGRRGRGRRGRA